MINQISVTTTSDNVLAVDSRLIAKQLGIHHGDWMRNVIKKYQSQAEQAFGILRFKNGEIIGRGQPEKFVLLTEDQAFFYMTLSRNTPEVVRLKALLVQKFSEARKLLRQQQNIIQEDLLLADFVQRSMIRCGVKEEVAEQIVLSELSKMHPSKSPLLLSSKNTISANNPLPDAPLTPTEVGIELTAILGYKVSARKVNKKLLALGYQISITRTKRSNKKEVHHYYKATSKGEQHSTLLLNAYSDGEGKATQPQLKWYRSIVSILKNNWD